MDIAAFSLVVAMFVYQIIWYRRQRLFRSRVKYHMKRSNEDVSLLQRRCDSHDSRYKWIYTQLKGLSIVTGRLEAKVYGPTTVIEEDARGTGEPVHTRNGGTQSRRSPTKKTASRPEPDVSL